jgi:hypothetical protein
MVAKETYFQTFSFKGRYANSLSNTYHYWGVNAHSFGRTVIGKCYDQPKSAILKGNLVCLPFCLAFFSFSFLCDLEGNRLLSTLSAHSARVWRRLGKPECTSIRALSAHSAAEFNILPGRWQHVCLVHVAIAPSERWGEMDRNDCHTAW